MSGQLRLYNGIEYIGYPTGTLGNPYYLNDSLTLGSVTYDGIKYDSVPLIYDMVKDVLVIKYAGTPFRIRLVNSKLSSFDVSGHHFVRIEKNSIPGLKAASYDELYNGSCRLLALRSALTPTVIIEKKAVIRIDPKEYYFIVMDSITYPVSSARVALRIVKDNGEIRTYLKKNKLRYRKQKDLVLTTIVSYHDKISR